MPEPVLMPEPAVAFLAKHKLHVRRNGVTHQLESEFEQNVRERAASIERRHSWKTQGNGARFMGRYAAPTGSGHTVPVMLTGLSAVPDGSFLYSIETDAISGVFLLDSSGVETRLFHTADVRIRHVALDPGGTTIAATAFHTDGFRCNIVILPLHGTDLNEVTDGDSFDQLPQWVPSGDGAKSRRIVFQSSGIGRNAAGQFAGFGNGTIQQLDLDSGELEEIASESGFDLLQPRKTVDGSLYYVRKPYENGRAPVSLVDSLKDAALFPFRMAGAIFQFLNIFSMMYSGKSLITAKGAAQRRFDPRQLIVNGNLSNAHAALSADDESLAAVPSSWELVRRRSGGQPEVLASGVYAFDVAADSSVFYSDGARITRLSPDGHSESILKAELIERVLAL